MEDPLIRGCIFALGGTYSVQIRARVDLFRWDIVPEPLTSGKEIAMRKILTQVGEILTRMGEILRIRGYAVKTVAALAKKAAW